MSGKKRVTFKETNDESKSTKMRRLGDVKYDHEYLEDEYYSNKKEDEDDDGITTFTAQKGKDSSDEEENEEGGDDDEDDEGNGKKDYEELNKDVLDEIGQEEKTDEFDNEIKITPFNMKEELEEGGFDTDGFFHWKSRKGEVQDAWLDNINWTDVNTFKKFKGQENLLNAAAKSGVITSKYDITATEDENEKVDENDESTNESFSNATLNANEQTELFKKILEYLKPGETILKAIKRLGNKSGTNKTNLSASQRWLKKKQNDTASVEANSEEATKNANALEKLTSLANQFIDMGYYDVYEETYEKIKFKLDQKNNSKKEADFDIFADEVDESELNKAKSSTATESEVEDKIVKWVYKLTNNDEDNKVFGPYSSEQMLKMSLDGKFKETGVWCRKVDDESSSFYNSKRIDFDLYT